MEHARRSYHEFLAAAQPVARDTRELFGTVDALVLLSDPAGVLLDVQGSRRMLKAGKGSNIAPGGRWEEGCSGTNGLGTAVAINNHVQIFRTEHYSEIVAQWTCAAALVRDRLDGSVLGVFDVSYNCDALDFKALPWAVYAANRVEAILFANEMARQRLLLDKYLDYSGESRSDGVVLLDRKGRLVRSNKQTSGALAYHSLDAELIQGKLLECRNLDDDDNAGLDIEQCIDQDYCQPITYQGERIGSMLILPFRSPRAVSGKPIAPAQGRQDQSLLDEHRTPAMRKAVAHAKRVAGADIPVLLQGETGTGKEVMARAIHAYGSRASKPFVAVNCGAMPRELIGSELFGHAEGAFTGARRGGSAGKFEEANGGTLFLDEIGELPIDLQPYLLRVLEDKEIVRLGSNAARAIDVRIVASSNRNLERAVGDGAFREDLFYRFSVSIRLPPLRERRDDLDRYLDRCLRDVTEQAGVTRHFSDDLRGALGGYAFPGNLRELKNIVQHLVLIGESETLTRADLPDFVRQRLSQAGNGAVPGKTGNGQMHNLKAVEAQAIADALEAEQGNRNRAAKRLGISRTTLFRRLHALDSGSK
ncbi:MAG: sigma 54-interacting transcriptional regulator [Salinisphaera sp.]|nr:sigma 54-interacting transcriptional regulator [Salinisphaera sp.]